MDLESERSIIKRWTIGFAIFVVALIAMCAMSSCATTTSDSDITKSSDVIKNVPLKISIPLPWPPWPAESREERLLFLQNLPPLNPHGVKQYAHDPNYPRLHLPEFDRLYDYSDHCRRSDNKTD